MAPLITEQFNRFVDAYWNNCQLGMTLAEKNLQSFLDPNPVSARETYHGVTPFDVIFHFDTMRVLRFRSRQKSRDAKPVIVIPSLINRSYVSDLMKGNSMIEDLLSQGLQVYMIDWGEPGPQHDHLSFEFFCDDLIDMGVKSVCKDCGIPKAGLIGYCMGGTMALLYSTIHPECVDRLTLLAAPFDFHNDGALACWVGKDQFDVEKVIAVLGHAEAWMLQSSFLWLRPSSQYHKIKNLYETCSDPKSFSNFVALESWVNDNTNVPGRAYADFVKLCYQENSLVKGKFRFGKHDLDLKSLTAPILTIIATKDHIVPPGSSRAISGIVSAEVKNLEIDAGHIGVVMGRKAKKMFEAVAQFHQGK